MLWCLEVFSAQWDESSFAVDVWGTADGLPQSSVIALLQSRDGYLWLGTLNGLVRFDGNSFTRFNVNNTPGLPDNRVVFLFEDSRTNLWVGTESGGLCFIKDGVARKLGTGSGKVTYAYEDGGGTVWFCEANGRFFCFKDGRLDLNPGVFSAQLFYRAAHLLVPGNAGVDWYLQGGRVEKRRGDQLEKVWDPAPWTNATVLAAIADPDGNLVVGTMGAGLFWADAAGNWRRISVGQGLSQATVLALAFDREGNLWAGTDGGGVSRIKRKSVVIPKEFNPWVAQSIAEDANGGLWVAYNGRGLSYWQSNSLVNYGIGLAGNGWSVLVDRHEQVWAGSRGEGLFRFMADNFQPFSGAEKMGSHIYALFESRDGTIWAGGQFGLASYDGSKWKIWSTAEGLPQNSVRAIAEDVTGNLWVGTEGGGLFRRSDEKFSDVSAPVKDISCLLFDGEKVLWVGTSGHGLAQSENGKWSVFSTVHGRLASDNIGYLLDDGRGNLWIGSYEGLLRVEKKSFSEFAAGRSKTIVSRTFLTSECSAGAQPAACATREGKLWFPTTQGVVGVDPAEIKQNLLPPPVMIESVVLDGREINTNLLNSAVNLSAEMTPDNEQLEIHYTSLSFSAPKGAHFGARFKYRLEGRDKNWTEVGAERVAHFNKLSPGKYTFQVIACNEDGVWNEVGAKLLIIVHPPVWQKPWFIVAGSVAVLGLLAGVIYLISTAKLKRQLRIARQKELLEQERSRIARDLHDQLGANLTQVALLGEMAHADKHLPAEVEQHAGQIVETARETTRSLDEIVWAVNPANDTLEGLANYACKYAQDYFALAGVSFRPELPPLPKTPILPEVRHNVFLAFKEAVNNVVKHAKATEARVTMRLEATKFILQVADNGVGLGDLSAKQLRNGLKNMRKRLADVHGQFDIFPGQGGGTVVTFTIPLAPN